jgi:hypothetical protein
VVFVPINSTSSSPLEPLKSPMPPTTAIGPESGCGPVSGHRVCGWRHTQRLGAPR